MRPSHGALCGTVWGASRTSSPSTWSSHQIRHFQLLSIFQPARTTPHHTSSNNPILSRWPSRQPSRRGLAFTRNLTEQTSIKRPGKKEDQRALGTTIEEGLRDESNIPTTGAKPQDQSPLTAPEAPITDLSEDFGRSEKASQAAQVDLSARLGNEPKSTAQVAGFGEIWRLIKVARPEAKPMGVAVGLLLVSSSITMAIPFSIGKILDVATNAQTGDAIFGLPPGTFYLTLGGVLVLGASANYGRIIVLRIVGERLINRLRAQLFKRTIIQDAEFFDANRVGDLISRLSSDTVIVGKSITQNLSDGLRSLISGGAGAGLMAYTSFQLTGILSLAFPPIGIAAFFYGRAIRNLSRRIQRSLGTLTKIAEERLGNVRTTQAFAAEATEVNRYDKQVRKIFNLGKREAFISATFFSASGLMGNMTMLALLYFGGGMVKSGAMSIGELTSFLMYTAYAGSSLFGLSAFYSELMKGVGAASRLFELQDRYPKLSPTKGTPVPSARGPIRFENVAFSYPTRPAVSIFTDLNFEVAQGTNVAIVGPSGGGKSTIASLLLRFYSPTSGSVKINGTDITSMNAKQLRRKIGYVGQEPVLFTGTIAENIAYGVPKATRSEITTAARKANCTFISDFPDGLDTNVGPRGTQLSGGQKQRIAIARALIKNPDILILDEATSALDAESETLVNSALATLLREKNTTISIAHRLSTIKRSDQIIVLSNDGKVADQGSYKDLSNKRDGAFQKLMEWQMSSNDGSEGPGAAAARSSMERGGRPTELEEMEASRRHKELQEDERDEQDDEEAIKAKQERTTAQAEEVK